MNQCQMCGKTSTLLTLRWYKYDNGEQFRSSVCSKCAAVHDKLVSKND